jgi:hypothetical protein
VNGDRPIKQAEAVSDIEQNIVRTAPKSTLYPSRETALGCDKQT